MQDVADQSLAPTAIGADLCAIFVSLELSRSTWLTTSLSPGRGEKMSKHSVSAGGYRCAAGALFSELRRKACARTGKSFPIVVIQEAGFDGFWIHRVLLSEAELRAMLSMQPRLRPRAGGGGPRPTGSMARLCFARCSPAGAANRGSAQWFGRRRRKMKTAAARLPRRRKRADHGTGSARQPDRRIALSLRAHPGMSRCVTIGGAAGYAQTGDGRRLPPHLKAQVCRELGSASNCCSSLADQGCGGRARRVARRSPATFAVGSAADVVECPWRWAGVPFGPLV